MLHTKKSDIYRPYAKMVLIHFCCLVKFLKMLMVALKYI